MSTTFDEYLDHLRQKVFPLGRLTHGIAQSVEPPQLVGQGADKSFRFENPKLIHFCLLRAARIVSGLNASIDLARSGVTQEIAVILRTVIEYSTHIDFMMASLSKAGVLSVEAEKFLTGYFEDAYRRGEEIGKKAKLNQRNVHEVIGARLEENYTAINGYKENRKTADRMLSNIYLIFSNYVHGRYPESMDMYGGEPGRFHLNGMRGTPKDHENILILDAQIKSSSLCFIGMVQGLGFHSVVKADPMLVEWYSRLGR